MRCYTSFLNSKSIDLVLDESNAQRISQREENRLKNRDILSRLIDVVLCLAKNGKPFRDHDEKDSSVYKDLFLEFLEVLKKYDSVLKIT